MFSSKNVRLDFITDRFMHIIANSYKLQTIFMLEEKILYVK